MKRLLAGFAAALVLALTTASCDKDVYLGAAPEGDAAVGDAGAAGDGADAGATVD